MLVLTVKLQNIITEPPVFKASCELKLKEDNYSGWLFERINGMNLKQSQIVEESC